ncbi:MAG: ABC transporter permease, partial [Oscillospiraceae bacterium]|nr:ABC transporter permease [Oscillospiraceae bacterium]
MDLKTLFLPLDASQKNGEFIAMESKSFAKDVCQRFCGNRRALFGLVLLGCIVLLAVFGAMASPYTYDGQDTAIRNLPPHAQHWF